MSCTKSHPDVGILIYDFFFFSHQATADYEHFGTDMDVKDQLDRVTNQKVVKLSLLAAQVAGQMVLRLVHDHILKLDVTTYGSVINKHVSGIISRVNDLKRDKVMLFVICVVFAMRCKKSLNQLLICKITCSFLNILSTG